MLAIQPGNRKAFYREIQELLDHGDDGEPLALVIADGHYHLTRFEDCQAVRSKGDHRAVAGQSSGSRRSVIGQSSGSHRAVTGQSLATNAPKSLRTETELGTEDRGKKIEVRSKKIEDRSYDVDGDRLEDPEPDSTASASASSNGAADQDAGLWLREEYDRRWQARYGRPRNWTSYQIHFDSIVRQAAEQPGDTLAAMGSAMDAFLADPDQQQYGDHSPQSLAKLFHRYVAQHREQIEALESKRKAEAAERRHQEAKAAAEAKHWQEVQAKQRQRQSNGEAVPGNNLGIDPASLADVIASQPKGDR
jgi:hypothetical protein